MTISFRYRDLAIGLVIYPEVIWILYKLLESISQAG